jgi:hypothetical protein
MTYHLINTDVHYSYQSREDGMETVTYNKICLGSSHLKTLTKHLEFQVSFVHSPKVF